MKESLAEAWDIVAKRVSNPFVLSWLLAWPITNYKLFVVLFSKESFQRTFEYVDKVLYPDPGTRIRLMVLIPAGAALFYTFVWPLIDAEISAVVQRLANRKESKVMAQRRKLPIAIEDRDAFFQNNDAENATLRKRLDDAYARSRTDSGHHASVKQHLSQSLRRQAMMRLIDSGSNDDRFRLADLVRFMTFQKAQISGTDRLVVFQKLAARPKLMQVVSYLYAVPLLDKDPDGTVQVDLEWVKKVLSFKDDDDAWDFCYLLEALGLARGVNPDQRVFMAAFEDEASQQWSALRNAFTVEFDTAVPAKARP